MDDDEFAELYGSAAPEEPSAAVKSLSAVVATTAQAPLVTSTPAAAAVKRADDFDDLYGQVRPAVVAAARELGNLALSQHLHYLGSLSVRCRLARCRLSHCCRSCMMVVVVVLLLQQLT